MGGCPTTSRSPRRSTGCAPTPLCRFAAALVLATLLPTTAARLDAETVSSTGFTSARVCGECHSDIYDSWKNSLHAFSLTDPIFDTAFMQAIKEKGEEARKICLSCHAPMVMVNADFELREGVTREGVSCDFCHTVTAVHLDGRQPPYTVDVGPVKRSVIRSTSSPAHEVAYSELHESSEFCGGCHNYSAPNGAAIMSTYDEWKAGPYAREGVQCQDCHMVRSEGRVVAREIRDTRHQMHLHNLIHDADQLRSALTVRIVDAKRAAGQLLVDIEVENVGSGHMVPTGMPTREVLLTATLQLRNRSVILERRFRKVVADEKGRVLNQDFEILLHGSRVLNDTRIAPRESRLVRFTFDLPPTERMPKVSAVLSYLYSPPILREENVKVELGRAERVVN